MIDGWQSLIERAYELARSGECRNMKEIKRRLEADGFANVRSHLDGATITEELDRLCLVVQGEQGSR